MGKEQKRKNKEVVHNIEAKIQKLREEMDTFKRAQEPNESEASESDSNENFEEQVLNPNLGKSRVLFDVHSPRHVGIDKRSINVC